MMIVAMIAIVAMNNPAINPFQYLSFLIAQQPNSFDVICLESYHVLAEKSVHRVTMLRQCVITLVEIIRRGKWYDLFVAERPQV